jgi:hypothetical protein
VVVQKDLIEFVDQWYGSLIFTSEGVSRFDDHRRGQVRCELVVFAGAGGALRASCICCRRGVMFLTMG